MAMLKLTRYRKQGQAVTILAALILVPLATLLLFSIQEVEQTSAGNTAVLASTTATVAALAAISEADGEITEDAIITAACRAMDQFLPARILSVGVGRNSVRVVVGAPTSDDDTVVHTFSGGRNQLSRSGAGLFLDQSLLFNYSGAELVAQVPACVGRAS